MKSGMLILVAILIFVVLCSLPAFLRWRKKQSELRDKLLSRISNRSESLFNSLRLISDRYLARDTKLFIVEHLLSVIDQLNKANYSSDFVSKHVDLVGMLAELKSGEWVAVKDRVSSQEQLDQIHNALQFMLRELRNMSESYGVNKVIIRHHIVLVHYAHALAYRDLLVRQARQDLDNNKLNRALEKYRVALSVIEKNGSVGSSKREIVRLQSMIQEVENILFSKNNKADIKLK